MTLFLQSNNIDFKRSGSTVSVPDNDVACLMYCMHCVCTSINCNNDPDIQRFTSYNNWAGLSVADQTAPVVVCYACSPDVLNDRVFFQSDELCGNSNNEFYKINQISSRVVAAESIVIAGQTRVINKIMTYKMQWMRKFYFDPMERLVARLHVPSRTSTPVPAISYPSPTNYQPYRPAIEVPSSTESHRGICCRIWCWLFVLILGIIVIVIGVIIGLNQRGST